jgi:chromate reductase
VKVLAISGSLRSESYNTGLLRALAEEAPAGIEVELWNGLREIPAYDADDDLELGPAPVEELRAAVLAADAVVFATPEYNSSIPGALKNALDWASRPFGTHSFYNKPVAVLGSSTGAFGGVWSQAELRKVLGAMGARVAEVEVAVGHVAEKFNPDGELVDASVRQQLRDTLQAVGAEVDAGAALAA